MATVTVDFYRNTYHGPFDGGDADLLLLLERAEDIIDSEIFLTNQTVSSITDRRQTAVYKAVCAQVDFINSCGGLDGMTDVPISSATLGRFSYSAAGGVTENQQNPSEICTLAAKYLQPTGLLYRGL